MRFEFFRKAPKAAFEAPPPFEGLPLEFDPALMQQYEEAAERDEKLGGLLARRAEISEHQASGNGVFDDARIKDELERAIALRYAELSASR